MRNYRFLLIFLVELIVFNCFASDRKKVAELPSRKLVRLKKTNLPSDLVIPNDRLKTQAGFSGHDCTLITLTGLCQPVLVASQDAATVSSAFLNKEQELRLLKNDNRLLAASLCLCSALNFLFWARYQGCKQD